MLIHLSIFPTRLADQSLNSGLPGDSAGHNVPTRQELRALDDMELFSQMRLNAPIASYVPTGKNRKQVKAVYVDDPA